MWGNHGKMLSKKAQHEQDNKINKLNNYNKNRIFFLVKKRKRIKAQSNGITGLFVYFKRIINECKHV